MTARAAVEPFRRSVDAFPAAAVLFTAALVAAGAAVLRCPDLCTTAGAATFIVCALVAAAPAVGLIGPGIGAGTVTPDCSRAAGSYKP